MTTISLLLALASLAFFFLSIMVCAAGATVHKSKRVTVSNGYQLTYSNPQSKL